MRNKNVWMIIGFLMIVFGFTSIVLQMVGIQWYFLQFLEWGGHLMAFVLKLVMMMAGALLFIMARIDWEQERKELM